MKVSMKVKCFGDDDMDVFKLLCRANSLVSEATSLAVTRKAELRPNCLVVARMTGDVLGMPRGAGLKLWVMPQKSSLPMHSINPGSTLNSHEKIQVKFQELWRGSISQVWIEAFVLSQLRSASHSALDFEGWEPTGTMTSMTFEYQFANRKVDAQSGLRGIASWSAEACWSTIWGYDDLCYNFSNMMHRSLYTCNPMHTSPKRFQIQRHPRGSWD